MNILFEEDGVFRAGTVLADNTTSLQVELASGKRSKVKAANVLQRFAAPAPGELLERAEAEAETIDVDFLWEVCGDAEFAFEELAAEYHGAKPDAVQTAAVLLRLHAAPMYFHRKGRGRFRKAPPEILQAALAGLEKKRQQVLAIERMVDALKDGRLPTEFGPILPQLIYKPDRNRGNQGAGSCLRRDRQVRRPPAVRLRRAALDPRLPPGALPLRVLSGRQGRHRICRIRRPSGAARSAAGRGGRLQRRRRSHHRD